MSARHNRSPRNLVETAAVVATATVVGAVALFGGRGGHDREGQPRRDGGDEPSVEYVTRALPSYESARRKDGSIDYFAKKIVQKGTITEDGEGGLEASINGQPVSVTIRLPRAGRHEDRADVEPAPGEPSVHYRTPSGDTSVVGPPEARAASREHGIGITISEDGHGGLAATHHGEPVQVDLNLPEAGPGRG